MSQNGDIWPIKPHTAAKHVILREYLKAWFPIMTRYNARVIVLDGFAGPGMYSGGEPGSPLVAMETLATHTDANVRLAEVLFLLIEQDPKRCAQLRALLETRTLPPKAKYKVYCGGFDETLSDLLGLVEVQSIRLAPTFAFIDPFGYSRTPMETIARFMRHPQCEVLINFMYSRINRFAKFDNTANQVHLDGLFGTTEWRTIIERSLSPKERERAFHDLYQRQLLTAGGTKYVRSFRMRNTHNQCEYYLFFGTPHLLGMDKMKQAMWKVDPFGGYDFSDDTNSDQLVLFGPEPDYALLQRMLLGHFRGTIASVQDIETFVIAETPFHSGQYKTNALKALEKKGEIVPIRAPEGRKAGTYADSTIELQFR
jgi:three-Cys-motif partner protein